MIPENKCDIHTHTLFSRHAYSTIMENVTWAKKAGLELLGSADHFSSMQFPEYKDHRNYQYLFCEKDWPRWIGDLCLLRGCEADIVNREGDLFGQDIPISSTITGDLYRDGESRTLYGWATSRMDYVIASVHGKDFTRGLDEAGITEMYLGALRQKKVLVLGHIGRTGLDFAIDEVLREAGRLHKMIEFNEHSFDSEEAVERCRKIALRCAELGVPAAVTTDAHICLKVGQVSQVLGMLNEIHFPQELIMTRSRKTLLRAMKESGVCDLEHELSEEK